MGRVKLQEGCVMAVTLGLIVPREAVCVTALVSCSMVKCVAKCVVEGVALRMLYGFHFLA